MRFIFAVTFWVA